MGLTCYCAPSSVSRSQRELGLLPMLAGARCGSDQRPIERGGFDRRGCSGREAQNLSDLEQANGLDKLVNADRAWRD